TRRSSGKARETPPARTRAGGVRPTRQSGRQAAKPGRESILSPSPARARESSTVASESAAGLETESAALAPDGGSERAGGREEEERQETSGTTEAAPQVPAELRVEVEAELQTLAGAAIDSPASAVKRRRSHAPPQQTSDGVRAEEAVAPEGDGAEPEPSAEISGGKEPETAPAPAAAAVAVAVDAQEQSRKVPAGVSADEEAEAGA
ncbi:unnamed protein product, partial [Laminaria digitata]